MVVAHPEGPVFKVAKEDTEEHTAGLANWRAVKMHPTSAGTESVKRRKKQKQMYRMYVMYVCMHVVFSELPFSRIYSIFIKKKRKYLKTE